MNLGATQWAEVTKKKFFAVPQLRTTSKLRTLPELKRAHECEALALRRRFLVVGVTTAIDAIETMSPD
jgi:hypothetical protein